MNLISRNDVENYYPFLTKRLLEFMAYRNTGPDYAKIGRECYYKPEDIEAYIAEEFNKVKEKRSAERARTEPVEAKSGKPGRPRKQPTQVAA
jgi:hypothetical protein